MDAAMDLFSSCNTMMTVQEKKRSFFRTDTALALLFNPFRKDKLPADFCFKCGRWRENKECECMCVICKDIKRDP